MNRFSQQQTLSNSTTAVRETVDFMNAIALAIFFALAVLVMPLKARAETTPAPVVVQQREAVEDEVKRAKARAAAVNAACDKTSKDYTYEACEAIRATFNMRSDDRETRQCTSFEEKITKASEEASKQCSNAGIGGGNLARCYVHIDTCTTEDAALDELDQEDEGGRQPFCDRVMASKCSGLSRFATGRDYRQEKRDAERDRLEAKKEVDDILKDQKDLKKELVQQQRELQEEQMKNSYAQRQQEREVANNMKEALSGISDNQKKAYDDIQKAYNQIDADYIGMRAQIQQTADAVAQAEEDLQTTCRAAAERKYAEAEKIRKAELAKRSQNAGNNVSGSTARKKAATTRQRNIDYTAYLTECTSGVSAEGSAARSKITAAQRAKASTEKLLNEKAALIEKQRAQMLKKLQDMESEATNQQSQVVEKINEQLTAMNEKQQLTAQLNQQRITEFQQNQSSAMQTLQERLNTANQELMRTQQEASLATTRESCAGTTAQRNDSKREKTEEGFASAVGSIKTLDILCRQRDRTSCTVSLTDEDKKGDICTLAKNAVQGLDQNKKRVSRPEVMSTGGKTSR